MDDPITITTLSNLISGPGNCEEMFLDDQFQNKRFQQPTKSIWLLSNRMTSGVLVQFVSFHKQQCDFQRS